MARKKIESEVTVNEIDVTMEQEQQEDMTNGELDMLQDETKAMPDEESVFADESIAEKPEMILEKPEAEVVKVELVEKGAEEEGDDAELQQEMRTDESAPRGRSSRRPAQERIVPIDDQATVATSDDKRRSDQLDLIESLKGRRILTGTIQGVERSEGNTGSGFGILYHGQYKVIIPAEQMITPPADFRDRNPDDVMHYLMIKRLGAEIDYIVKGFDEDAGIAVASRLEAMTAKRREHYFDYDRLRPNVKAEARVVSVIRSGLFIELFGVESFVPLRELSYQRILDAGNHYQTGQRILIKILAIDKTDRRNVRVEASVKQAMHNPYENAFLRYAPGNRYVGTVSMVDKNGVFVSLEDGVDCLCQHPRRGRPPRGSRVTVRILGVNQDTNRIWGAITHMAPVI